MKTVFSELLDGRSDTNSKKAVECFEMLEQLNIPFQRVEYDIFPSENHDLEELDALLETPGIKNLLFNTKAKDYYVMLVMKREHKFNEKDFRREHNLTKLSMTSKEDLKDLLHTEGGSVSILELMYDKEKQVHLYVEKDVLNEEYFRFHPNDAHCTLRISMDDFKEKLLPYLNHKLNII